MERLCALILLSKEVWTIAGQKEEDRNPAGGLPRSGYIPMQWNDCENVKYLWRLAATVVPGFFFFFTIQIVIKSPPARRMEVCRASWKKKNQQFGRLNSNRSSNDTNDYGSLFAALFEPPRSISILPFFLFPSSLPSPTSFIEPLYSSTTINLSSRISPSSSISCERDSTSLFKIYSGCY